MWASGRLGVWENAHTPILPYLTLHIRAVPSAVSNDSLQTSSRIGITKGICDRYDFPA